MKKKYLVTLGSLGALFLSTVTLASCGGQAKNFKDPAGVQAELNAKTVYVTPTGTALGDGTKANPYNFETAINKVTPGSTILLATGTYEYDDRIQVPASGAEYGIITVKPEEENGRVVFDFSAQVFDGAQRGIQIYGDFWHFKNLEITGAGDNGMYIAGSHNIIEDCIFYNNRDTGLQLGRGYSNETKIDEWPSDNLIKNCTSFANYDAPTFGENADGFAAKLTIGYGNVFDGCMAFRNSDDGWDLFAKVDSGNIGTVVLYNCVSFENGYLPYQIDKEDGSGVRTYNTLNGDGIGFKLGGSTMEGNVLVENCAAWDNKLHGVGDNSNPGVISVKNFTAYNNCSGLNADGTIRSIRGIDADQNKSNNIDLARSTASYNNYYGVLSFVNNQTGFSTANDSSYNKDAFRGSVAYSAFQTGYKSGEGELYNYFTGYEDGSSYSSDSVDSNFSSGRQEIGYVTAADFKSLTSVNAVCSSVDNLESLITLSKNLRNEDNSINLGDHLALADGSKFKTYANGNAIGATLNKTSDSAYNHYELYNWAANNLKYTEDEIAILDASKTLEVIADYDAVYQDFKLPTYINGCDVNWKSSNKDIVTIEKDEKYTISNAVYTFGRINVPDREQKVKLTATITRGGYGVIKEFEILVKGRKQSLGDLISSNGKVIRVDLYGFYAAPYIYATDASSISVSELPASTYTLSYKYRYATDGNAKFYNVDNVYTSIPGVYEVTATATWVADNQYTSSFKFFVYIVDPDCDIDFMADSSTVTLSNEGFVVSGNLSNIEGDVIAVTSPTQLQLTSAADILANPNYQTYHISSDSVVAKFTADNSSEVTGSTQYYIYYAVVNDNRSNAANAQVYSKTVNVVTVDTNDKFYSLARTGKLTGVTATSTTIYSLTADLDFEGYEWNIKTPSAASFTGLFKGNNHTIKNISVTGDSKDQKTVNVFYKLEGGTVMDVFFDNISIVGDGTLAKQVGIIGEFNGGYVHNVHASKIISTGRESVGGIIGQITGGENTITQCSLVNPSIPANTENTVEAYNAANQYKIAAKNKYAGGIVGNGQKNSDQDSFKLTIKSCYVNAIIGDGGDAGGNTGLIIGRIKNEYTLYETEIATCVAYGTVISHGQYGSGIVGDFDNGLGYVSIHGNLSMVQFFYNGLYLNAKHELMTNVEAQSYAHKNMNPIVGRAVKADDGIYETKNNLGSFAEYYSTDVYSTSLYFGLSDYADSGEFKALSRTYIESYTELDLDEIWDVIPGATEEDDVKVILKVLNKN